MVSELQQLKELLNERFDGLQQTLTARLEAVDERRIHGDNTLRQNLDFVNDQMKGFTRDLGGLEVKIESLGAKIERSETDVNNALQSYREQLHSTLESELAGMMDEVKSSFSAHGAARGSVEGRVKVIEDKLNAIKWAAIGLGLGSGVTSGGVVALLTGALG